MSTTKTGKPFSTKTPFAYSRLYTTLLHAAPCNANFPSVIASTQENNELCVTFAYIYTPALGWVCVRVRVTGIYKLLEQCPFGPSSPRFHRTPSAQSSSSQRPRPTWKTKRRKLDSPRPTTPHPTPHDGHHDPRTKCIV